MGNICCPDEEEKPQRQSIRPIADRSRKACRRTPSPSETRFHAQKQLLHEFSLAVRYLKQKGKDLSSVNYVKFFLHLRLFSDVLTEHYSGTILDENGIEYECVIKKISKVQLRTHLLQRNLSLEYLLTKYIECPFIAGCLSYFENEDHFYLFFDLRRYEHLGVFVKNMGNQQANQDNQQATMFFQRDVENHVRFVAAGVILGLEKLHSLGVVYRGIDTGNIVIQENGYPTLTNLSRLHPEGHRDATPAAANSFTSPEEFRGEIITACSDCWALGVLLYYLCRGELVHYSTFRQREFKDQRLSQSLLDFVNQLLLLKPEERLGSRGILALKEHRFFDSFDWRDYEEMSLESPLVAGVSEMRKDMVSQEYNNQGTMTQEDNGFGGMGLGSIIFMDMAALYMMDQFFEDQDEPPEMAQPNANFGVDQFQMASEIDLDQMDLDAGDGDAGAGDFDGGDCGGD